ncbi:MAG: HYR domain-containing protein, partial [Sphingobacteriales bacterium]
ITDNTAPVASAQNVTVQLSASGSATVTAAQVNNQSSDACGIASMTVSPNNFTCANAGANPVVLTVTDANGNVSTASATVTVVDNIAPVAICQNITLQLDATGQATIPAGNNNQVFYNYSCDLNTGSFSNVSQTFTAAQTGFITTIGAGIGTWGSGTSYGTTITSGASTVNYGTLAYSNRSASGYSYCASGNNMAYTTLPAPFHVTAGQTVTISFTGSGGEMHYQSGQLRMYVTGSSGLAIDGGSNDACGIASISASQTSFDCSNVGANNVTLTVTDNNGNSSTCVAIVTVEDHVAPVAVAQNVTVQLDNNGNASVTAAEVNNGSSDACGIASITVVPAEFSCANVGANTVTLTVTDNNGNESTTTAVVTVEDNVAPVAIAQNITLQLDASGQAGTTAAAVNNGSSDACGIASLSLSQTSFGCSNLGNNPVTLTVTDNNGNVSTASATVTVEDNIAPTIICNSDISITAQPNDCTPIVNWPAPVVADNCSFSVISSHNSGERFPVGTTTVTYTITDAAGNSSSCSFTVTVTPTPVVMSLASPTFAGGFNISCFGGNNGSATATVEGGCLPYSYAWSNGQTSATAPGLSAGTYSVTVTDANGTSVQQSITLTEPALLQVSGGISPSVAHTGAMANTIYLGYGPQSRTLSSATTGGVAAYSYNWTPATGLSSTTGASVTASPVVSTTYVLTVTDANGCTATAEYEITVIDARCGKDNNPKVIVCHNGHEICISANAVPAHLAHGCIVGPCGGNARTVQPQPETSRPVLMAYPNPTDGNFTLAVEASADGLVVLELFDISGRRIADLFHGTMESGQSRTININQTGLAGGIYVVRMQSAGEVTNLRISVQP